MKDYCDLMLLSQLYEFDGAVLHRAVRAAFKRRSTEVEPMPVGLSDDFALLPGKSAQWKAFLRRSRFKTDYANLDGVIRIVRGFCWTRIDSSCNRRRISVSLEAWWAVGNLGRDVGLGSTAHPR